MRTTLAILALSIAAWPALAQDNPMAEGDTWAIIAPNVIGDVLPQDGAALFALEAPYRAEDAATVPVVLSQIDPAAVITEMSLVIDENPAPLAATFRFGPAMHPVHLETRVRVNQYSNVRAIATVDGESYMTGRFVKASGGCSAPATRDPSAALAGMGEMRLRLFSDAPKASLAPGAGIRREAQIMIRHPNYSGLQRDQITQLFIPAHFIHELEVYQGEELLFSMEGGISISENPVFRFDYTDDGSPTLRIHAVDTQGNEFDAELAKDAPA